MAGYLPSATAIRERLAPFGHAQVRRLSQISGVPFTTLWKVKDGTTTNPGVETVRKFWPHIKSVEKLPQA